MKRVDPPTEDEREFFLLQCRTLFAQQRQQCLSCRKPLTLDTMRAIYCWPCADVHGVFCSPCFRADLTQREAHYYPDGEAPAQRVLLYYDSVEGVGSIAAHNKRSDS